MEVDIVIQGGMWESTVPAAVQYLGLPFVNKVIVSSWADDAVLYYNNEPEDSSRIEFIANIKPEIDGGGNMNYQIISSRAGIEQSTAGIVVKLRSDQVISNDSMKMMYDYHLANRSKQAIFVIGQMSNYPYHPQDHIFWGDRTDLINLFDLPLASWPTYIPPVDFTKILRAPIHLGAHYYKRFDSRVEEHIDNPKEYLLDGSPNFNKAMATYNNWRDKVFICFPKISLWWTKYNQPYPYQFYADQGEYHGT